MTHTIKIKPLSVNEAWKGTRYKTPKYRKYQADVMFLLPRIKVPEGKLRINFEFGMSNVSSDVDNPCKPFLDIMQKKYGFNDSRVYEIRIKKVVVDKKCEYVRFSIESIGFMNSL